MVVVSFSFSSLLGERRERALGRWSRAGRVLRRVAGHGEGVEEVVSSLKWMSLSVV